MYDKIVKDIKKKLSSLRTQLKWRDKSISEIKSDLANLVKERRDIEEKIEQYELLLIEMGIDPKEEEETK